MSAKPLFAQIMDKLFSHRDALWRRMGRAALELLYRPHPV